MADDPKHEPIAWNVKATIAKFDGSKWSEDEVKAGLAEPESVEEFDGNLLLTAGATLMWNLLIGAGGTVFSNANAHLGVGDSSTAEAVGQTDLQAATNKLRKAMDATYPSVSGATLTARATFGTGDANFAWNEWIFANASSAGTALNRKVASMGTKASGAIWQFTVTIALA